ncbi:sterol desaturase family protein [Leptospira sp. 96542]|nr:sterol desaturase family protein [Leptospira sp. 96542]
MRLIESIAPIYFVLILVELVYVRIKRKDFYHYEDSIVDLSLGVLSRIFDGLILLGIVATYQYLYSFFGWGKENLNWITNPNSSVHWVVLFILLDFLFYWAHRFSHEIKILWASHVVHHSSEEFNLTVALRQSFVRNIGIGIFYLPLAVFGFPVVSYLIIDALNRTYQFFVHTRAIGKLPAWFESIFVTPSHHRVHHAMNPEYIDKNYAGVFIFWDKLFGTFKEETVPPRYGLVTQLRNFDPIFCQIHVFKDMASDFWNTKFKWQAIRSFFSYPSVRPIDLIPKTKIMRIDQLYRPDPNGLGFRIYLFIQLLVPTIFTLYFLKKLGEYNVWQIISIIYLLVFSFVSLGVLITKRKSALLYEMTKFIFLSFLLVFFFYP